MKKIFSFIFALFMSVSCTAITVEPTLEVGVSIIRSNYEEFFATLNVRSSEHYDVTLNSNWARITNITEAENFDVITIYCNENTDSKARCAEILVTTNYVSKQVQILQGGKKVDAKKSAEPEINANGNNLTVSLDEPGTLYKMCRKYFDYVGTSNEYGEQVWSNITNVTLYGTIDARDFSTLKWNFRNLKNVDLSGVKITAYSGEYGTNEGYYDGTSYSVYEANEVPIGAFFYWQENKIRNFPSELYDEGMASLQSVKLPGGIKTIRRNAFARAYNLEEINIPEGVETVEMVAFRYCTSIEKLYLPSTIKNIGWLAFTDMYSLKEVHIKARYVPFENQSFGNYPDSDNRGYVNVGDVNYSKKTKAVLYVPTGCKDVYKDWEKYFAEVVEE